MTGRRLQRDAVDGLMADAHRCLAEQRAGIVPDFAAVLARQRGDEPVAEPAGQGRGAELEQLSNYGTLIDLREHARARTSDAAIDGLVASARATIECMAAEARLRPIPRMSSERARPKHSRFGLLIAAVSVAAAAGASLFLGIDGSQHVDRVNGNVADQAELLGTWTKAEGEAQAVEREFRAPGGGSRESSPVPQREGLSLEPTADSEIAATEPTSSGLSRSSQRASQPAKDTLRAWSEEANALWRAGDLAGAERRFEKVVGLGGRSMLSELAWGDLFAIARQLGDEGRRVKHWGNYLRRFPRGRYADDARAGLCRLAATPSRCWRSYLEDFPHGSYRAEAKGQIGAR